MSPTLLVVDNFAPNPMEIRDKALKAGFGPVVHFGDTYNHIGLSYDPGLVPAIEAAVGFPIVPKMQFFRCDTEEDVLKCAVHADVVCAKYASLLYLVPPQRCSGGTAFWTHGAYGWDSMPTQGQVRQVGEDPATYGDKLGEDWKHADRWTMNGFVSMRFNRFITYPTDRFHSRFPFGSFGDNFEDGRLIWVCFYDMLVSSGNSTSNP